MSDDRAKLPLSPLGLLGAIALVAAYRRRSWLAAVVGGSAVAADVGRLARARRAHERRR